MGKNKCLLSTKMLGRAISTCSDTAKRVAHNAAGVAESCTASSWVERHYHMSEHSGRGIVDVGLCTGFTKLPNWPMLKQRCMDRI